MGSTSEAEDVAIVLVDHGSKRAEANAMDVRGLCRLIQVHSLLSVICDGVQVILPIILQMGVLEAFNCVKKSIPLTS